MKFLKITITHLALAFMVLTGAPSTSMADDHAVDITGDSADWKKRSGLRFGYNYLNNGESPTNGESAKLRSPHMFAIGYELQQTMSGGDWLDILFIQNVTISGLEQSVIAPSANVLVGFEINDTVQLAVGGNLSVYDPSPDGNYIHLVTALGFTAAAGKLSVPLHLVFVPDVNDFWRIAITTGVNW